MIDYSALVEASVIAPTLAFSVTFYSRDNVWTRLGNKNLPYIMAFSALFFFLSALFGVIEWEGAVVTLIIAIGLLTYILFVAASKMYKDQKVLT